MLKHYCTSPAMAPSLQPAPTNIFLSKKTDLLGVKIPCIPIPPVQTHKRHSSQELSFYSIYPASPGNPSLLMYGLNLRVSVKAIPKVQEPMSDKQFWRSSLLVQVQGFSPLAKLNRRNFKCKKPINCCNPFLVLLGLTAELPPQAASYKLLVELEFQIIW